MHLTMMFTLFTLKLTNFLRMFKIESWGEENLCIMLKISLARLSQHKILSRKTRKRRAIFRLLWKEMKHCLIWGERWWWLFVNKYNKNKIYRGHSVHLILFWTLLLKKLHKIVKDKIRSFSNSFSQTLNIIRLHSFISPNKDKINKECKTLIFQSWQFNKLIKRIPCQYIEHLGCTEKMRVAWGRDNRKIRIDPKRLWKDKNNLILISQHQKMKADTHKYKK